MTVNLGIVGCADVALRRVLPAVARTAGIQVVAVASRALAKAEAVTASFGGAAVEGYERLIERTDVDAVYLPLPSALHAEWARRALRAGKHVLAEKPLTTNADDTAELVALARSTGLVLVENFMFVHHSQHAAVRGMVEAGAIGDVRAFFATFAIPARQPGDIRYRAELGGGALLDVGGYPIRAAQLFFGSELEVAGAALRHSTAHGVDVGGAVLLRTSDGVTAQLTFGLEHGYTSRYEFLGSAGRLQVEHVFTPPADWQPTVCLHRQDTTETIRLQPDDQYANTMAAFVRAVEQQATADDTLLVQAGLVDAARRLAGR